MSKSTQFQPGHSKLENSGRKQGTPNKQTRILIEELDELQINPLKIISEELRLLTPEKRVDVALSLMKYIYPTRKAIEPPPEIQQLKINQNDLDELIKILL